jgi:hypothetical protein
MPLPSDYRTRQGLWIHRDSSIAEAIQEGYDRCAQNDWSTGTVAQRSRAFLGLLAERSMLMASVGGSLEPNPAEGFAALINPSPLPTTTGERRQLVRALYATAAIFSVREQADTHVETNTQISETGIVIAWPVAAVAIAVVVAGAAAIAYCASQVSQIVDRQLSRSEDAQRLASKDAELMKLIREHQEREQKAGKQLPLSEPQKMALQGLLDQQHAIVTKQEGSLDSGLPGGGSLFTGLTGVVLGVAGGYALSRIL